jgi:hypothetical protein
VEETRSVRFFLENGDKYARIDNHFGNPRSS